MKLSISMILMINFIMYFFGFVIADLKVLQLNDYKYLRLLKYNIAHRKKRLLFYILPIIFFSIKYFNMAEKFVIIELLLTILIFVITIICTLFNVVNNIYPKNTNRIKRIFGAFIILLIIYMVLSLYIQDMSYIVYIQTITMILLTISSIFIVNIIELVLSYFYRYIALKKLKNTRLIKIAITGTYAKTSVKHILKTILSQKYSVLMSPKSYNTVNGLLLTINKNDLKKFDVLIMEMGAKKRGDIKELCKLFQPNYGILTSIGKQHLETFKNIENIIKAKSEIYENIGEGGVMIFNGHCEYVLNQSQYFNGDKLIVGFDDGFDVSAKNISLTSDGAFFDIYINGEYFSSVETILTGKHNILNILIAVAMSYKLGLSKDQIVRGILQLREVESRMQKSILTSGAIVINNGYNSNPDSARASLNLIGLYEDKKKIVITPGFVEMGKEQYNLNYEFGINIAKIADFCYVVNKTNRKALVDAFNSVGYESFEVIDKFKDVNFLLFNDNDVVLIENDLPENYE